MKQKAASKDEITALKAVVEYYEGEKVRIEQRLSEARGKFHAAEREITRRKKLTPLMVGIIRELEDGAVLKRSTSSYPYQHWWLREGQPYVTVTVPKPVFEGLLEREIIERGVQEGAFIFIYPLTAWGREVLAQAKRQPQ